MGFESFADDTATLFKVIESLFQKADEIVNCGDAGQEGELIQRWVMQKAAVKCPVKRLWISSLTEESIREGFKTLKDQTEYQSLYEAGLSRAIGDWLLGMNATRLYTLKYGQNRQVLSIGRVQTPTLALIVNRYHEIVNFKPEAYWVLSTIYRDTTFTATKGKYGSVEDGQKDLQSVEGKEFTVTDISTKKGTEAPPRLYDLTSLQVECNKKYNMSADQTLQTIQSLYEKKYTTYPRVEGVRQQQGHRPPCHHSDGCGTDGTEFCRAAGLRRGLPPFHRCVLSRLPVCHDDRLGQGGGGGVQDVGQADFSAWLARGHQASEATRRGEPFDKLRDQGRAGGRGEDLAHFH